MFYKILLAFGVAITALLVFNVYDLITSISNQTYNTTNIEKRDDLNSSLSTQTLQNKEQEICYKIIQPTQLRQNANVNSAVIETIQIGEIMCGYELIQNSQRLLKTQTGYIDLPYLKKVK